VKTITAISIASILYIGLISIEQGCGPSTPTVTTAVDLAGYSLALDECRLIGKDAGSYSVYEDCAKRMDIKFGRKDGGL